MCKKRTLPKNMIDFKLQDEETAVADEPKEEGDEEEE